MSAMIERAAKALFEFPYEEDEQPDVPWTGDDSEGDATVARGQARAALRAAFDPEDKALRKEVAKILYCCACNEQGARDAIGMLRDFALGDPTP